MPASKRRRRRAGSLSAMTAHWSTPPAFEEFGLSHLSFDRDRGNVSGIQACSDTADFWTAATLRSLGAPFALRLQTAGGARALRVLLLAGHVVEQWLSNAAMEPDRRVAGRA